MQMADEHLGVRWRGLHYTVLCFTIFLSMFIMGKFKTSKKDSKRKELEQHNEAVVGGRRSGWDAGFWWNGSG